MDKNIVIACAVSLVLSVVVAMPPIGKASESGTTLFSDDFESYSIGTFPSTGGWILVWNGQGTGHQVVSDAYSFSPTKSLQLWGRASWSSVAQRKFSTDVPVIGYECAIRIDSIGTGGPGREESVAFFNRDVYIWGRGYAAVLFNHDDGEIKAEDGTVLGDWQPGVWYRVKVVLDRRTNTYAAWIDGQLKGQGLSTISADTDNINALALMSDHAGVKVYYDDARVFTVDAWKASNPYPANGATDVSPNVILSWDYPYGYISPTFDVYLGTNFDAVYNAKPSDPEYVGNVGRNQYHPFGPLDLGETYYWRADTVVPLSRHKGDVWSFTTISGPAKATNPYPADGAADVPTDVVLSWTPGYGATSHDVYFGTSSPPAFIGNQAASSYDPGTLEPGTTYYWQIDAVEADGTKHTGDVWSFTTMSGHEKATNPYPADGAADVSPDVVLTWSPEGLWLVGHEPSSIQYDIYFGTDRAVVSVADTNWTDIDLTEVYRGRQEPNSHELERLKECKTYYWRIDQIEHYDGGSTVIRKGDVWSFTVAIPKIVDQSYLESHGAHGILAHYRFGQEFTPSMPKLIGVDVGIGAINPGGGDDIITMNIRQATIDGPILDTRSEEIQVPFNGLKHFSFPCPGVKVIPGNVYVIELTATKKTFGWWSNGIGYDAYPRGRAIRNGSPSERADQVFQTYAPTPKAWEPSPPDGAIDVSLDVVLGWLSGAYAASHDVYFGENPVHIASGAPDTFRGSQPGTIYDPPPLEPETTYYWRIDEVNNLHPDSPWKGVLWSFTTGVRPDVDADYLKYPDVTAGLAWAPVALGATEALIWTDDKVLRKHTALNTATELLELRGDGTMAPISNVQGIVWAPVALGGTEALIWTPDKVYRKFGATNTAKELKDGGTKVSISDVRGVVWAPVALGATEALIWTDEKVYRKFGAFNTAKELKGNGTKVSIPDVHGITWSPVALGGTEALIWNSDMVFRKSLALDTATELKGGTASIAGVQGIVWAPVALGGGGTEALIWNFDSVFRKLGADTTELKIAGVQGIVWAPVVLGRTEALLLTPGKVFRQLGADTTELKEDGTTSIFSYDPASVSIVQVVIHHAGFIVGVVEDEWIVYVYVFYARSGAGIVGKPATTPVAYTGSSTAAVVVPSSIWPSLHTTALGAAPYINTELILGPEPVAGVVAGNSMRLFGFYSP